MTLASTPPIVTYLENGVTLLFSVPFQFIAAADLVVTRQDPNGVRTLATLGADYSVAGGAGATGSVTMTLAKAVGWKLEIKRFTARTQPLDLTPGDTFPAESVESAFSRGVAISQEIEAKADDVLARAVRAPAGETLAELPAAAQRANSILGFGGLGALLLHTAQSLAAFLAPYLPAALKGDPGGNAMAVGAFTNLNALSIPTGTDLIRTTEHRAGSKKGGAFYRATPQANYAADVAYAAAHPGWTAMTANNRLFSLDEEQTILFEAFGAYGDLVTDDYPVWVKAKDYLQTNKRTHQNAYYKSVPELKFGRYTYYFSDSVDLTEGVYSISGTGPNALDQGGNTMFFFASGKCGFIFQSWDTTGVTGTVANTPKGSAYSHVSDISVWSLGGTVGAEQHGFLIKAPVTMERCFAYHFGGHGFFIAADVTHAGNANCGRLYGCGGAYNGLSGLKTVGGDSNAWDIFAFNGIFNGRFAIEEQSFLGNHYHGRHTQGNCGPSSGPGWALSRPGTLVHQTGHYYRVVYGQETGASTNAPTGAATNNTWWTYYGDGGVTAQFPQWVSGTTYVSGGAFLINGASNKSGVFGGYQESDEAAGLNLANRALVICGGFSSVQGGPQLNAHAGRIWTYQIGTGLNIGDGYDIGPRITAADDAAATLAGCQIGQYYNTAAGVVHVRLT